nr:hypothetical protein [uncultured Desulfobulbus sp.]
MTDLVLSEVLEDNIDELSRYLETRLLTKQQFTPAELGEVGGLFATFPALSLADCSCIYLAEKLDATLLTGDGALRRIATEREISVHGILWVLDEMISSGLVAPARAKEALLRLMEFNQRLPLKECKKQLQEW